MMNGWMDGLMDRWMDDTDDKDRTNSMDDTYDTVQLLSTYYCFTKETMHADCRLLLYLAPILIVSLWRPYSLSITYILLTSLNDDDTGDTGVLSVWLDIEYALQTVYG